MRNTNRTLVVGKIEIEDEEVELARIYSAEGASPFYAVASRDDAKEIRAGDTIECAPHNAHFGWFVTKK